MSYYESYRKPKSSNCCSSFCRCFACSFVSFTNLIDLVLGAVFAAYGIYLYTQTQNADADVNTTDTNTGDDNMKLSENANLLEYTEIGIFSLGVLLLFVGLFGTCGLVSKTLQCCLSFTSYLLLPVIILEIGLVAYMAKNRDDIIAFLDDNLDTFKNFTQDDIDEFTIYYNWVLLGVGISCLLHIFRFFVGRKLRSSYTKSDEEERLHLLVEKDEEEIRRQQRREENTAKWNRKRQEVQNKYDAELGESVAVIIN